ncbi:hypothetical protein Tco_0835813 [Tanacetum coccineum]
MNTAGASRQSKRHNLETRNDRLSSSKCPINVLERSCYRTSKLVGYRISDLSSNKCWTLKLNRNKSSDYREWITILYVSLLSTRGSVVFCNSFHSDGANRYGARATGASSWKLSRFEPFLITAPLEVAWNRTHTMRSKILGKQIFGKTISGRLVYVPLLILLSLQTFASLSFLAESLCAYQHKMTRKSIGHLHRAIMVKIGNLFALGQDPPYCFLSPVPMLLAFAAFCTFEGLLWVSWWFLDESSAFLCCQIAFLHKVVPLTVLSTFSVSLANNCFLYVYHPGGQYFTSSFSLSTFPSQCAYASGPKSSYLDHFPPSQSSNPSWRAGGKLYLVLHGTLPLILKTSPSFRIHRALLTPTTALSPCEGFQSRLALMKST